MQTTVPVLYKISTLVDASRYNPASCVPVLYKISTLVDRGRDSAGAERVPVLYKISTVVDVPNGRKAAAVPVLYKISTLVDLTAAATFARGSRSLQNFYSCRCARSRTSPAVGSRSLQNFYSCRSAGGDIISTVPVLYKISTLSVSASAAFSLSTRASASPSAAPG